MNEDKIREINFDRLVRWAENLTSCHATPVLVIGVGHDHRAGEVHVVTLEDMTDPQLALFLSAALQKITGRR